MPTYLPEGNAPLSTDTMERSLQKINDLLAGTAIDPLFSYFQARSHIYWCVGLTSSSLTAVGDGLSVLGTPSNSPPSATQPAMVSNVTGAVAGNSAGQYGNQLTAPRQKPRVFAVVRVPDSSSARIWISLHDGTSTSGTNAADPASRNLMGFRLDTSAGDTRWRCCTKDGVTLNNLDGGVDMSGNVQVLAMEHTGTSVKFYIDGVLVQTSSANLPSDTANCRLQVYIETLTSATKNIRLHSAGVIRTL